MVSKMMHEFLTGHATMDASEVNSPAASSAPGGPAAAPASGSLPPAGARPVRVAAAGGARGRGFACSPRRDWEPPPPLPGPGDDPRGALLVLEAWHDECWARAAADERLCDGLGPQSRPLRP